MFQLQGVTDQWEYLNNDWFVYLDYNHNAKTTMEVLVMELCKSREISGESSGYYEEDKAFLFKSTVTLYLYPANIWVSYYIYCL